MSFIMTIQMLFGCDARIVRYIGCFPKFICERWYDSHYSNTTQSFSIITNVNLFFEKHIQELHFILAVHMLLEHL